MSEFKFSCPKCQQNIQATSEYSGVQINCPSCQTLLVVPADPNAPAPQAPAAPAARLSKAATTPHPQAAVGAAAAASFYTEKPFRKKKSKNGLIAGLALGACAIAAVIFFWPTLMKKFTHESQSAAADQSATNAVPPPPPPKLTTEEILQKVGASYKEMTDYGAKARTDCKVEVTGQSPGRETRMNMTTTSSLQLGRTNNYRLEWGQSASGKTVKGAAWCSGKGNFIGYGAFPPTKVKSRQEALITASGAFFLLSSGIAELFFSDTNNLSGDAKEFTKTNGPSLNDQPCYVLAGEVNHETLLLWINKNTFLISQIELILGGKMDEQELKKLPSAQRNAMMVLSKLKGTITETYDSIQTNRNLVASAFESPYKPAATTDAPPRQRRPSSMAGQLANPGGRRQPNQ